MTEAGYQALGPFGHVEIGAGLSAHIARGEGFSVRVECEDDKRLSRLELRVVDGTLRAGCGSFLRDFVAGIFPINHDAPAYCLHIFITVPTLETVAASAGAHVRLEGSFGDRLDVVASTKSRLEIESFNGTTLGLKASTNAEIHASGACETFEVRFGSGAQIAATELSCTNAAVTGSNGGSLEVTVLSAITGNLTSGAQMHLLGRPERIDVKTSSGGQFMVA